MELETRDGSSDNRDTLYLMGGLALMVLGAGLIMSNPKVRNTVSAGLSSILPDFEHSSHTGIARYALSHHLGYGT